MMASLADRNLALAMRALVERNEKLAATVENEDTQLDELEVAIDELVINHMATHAPVATDCRFMLVASKISSNLERIADQAVAIARRSLELNREPLLKPLIDIPRMAQIAEGMLRDSVTAFIERKPELAQEIIKRDKEVDMINKQLARELTSFMLEDPATITRALNLTIVARCLERVADHCKNIAEEVYYLYQAIDIRHERAPITGA
jgi:phosphate transport system protein